MLAFRPPEALVRPNAVTVTLIDDRHAGQAASAPDPLARLADMFAASSVADTPPPAADAPRESLDSLFGPTRDVSAAEGASPSTPSPSGSSRVDQGLDQGEGAEGIDLYAAASLPAVGQRSASPPAGDLWNQVAPCWRRAAPRKAILMVEIDSDGGLAAPPQAVRKASAPVDPQTLLAERAAVRALQACAPYAGLGARKWRVAFP